MERLFGPQESTVTVAAVCRAAGQILGIQPEVAERFRNKNVMSACARELGIPTARWTRVTTRQGVLDFARDVGWPIIIKPIDAAGADGVVQLHSAKDFDHAWPALSTKSGAFRVEEFIQGIEYHIDSIMHGGRVVFTRLLRYLRPLRDFRLQPPGSVIRRNDLTAGERGIVLGNAQLLEGFGLVNGVSHNEWFVRPDGQPVFGEASARVGGGHAVPTIESATGVNMFAAQVCTELDPNYCVPEIRDLEIGGQLLPARASGVICAMTSPAQLEQHGVFGTTYWYRPGDHLTAAERSTRMFGWVFADGENYDAIAGKLHAAQAVFTVTVRQQRSRRRDVAPRPPRQAVARMG